MKGGLELTTMMIVLIVLAVIVLLLATGMVLSASGTANNVGTQNDLYDCCKKFLPSCSNLDVKCSSGETISSLAGKLGVDPFNFCGCV